MSHNQTHPSQQSHTLHEDRKMMPSYRSVMEALVEIERAFPELELQQIFYQLHSQIHKQKNQTLLSLLNNPHNQNNTKYNQCYHSVSRKTYLETQQLAIQAYLALGYCYNNFIQYATTHAHSIAHKYKTKAVYSKILDSSLISGYLFLLTISNQNQKNASQQLRKARLMLPILRKCRSYLQAEKLHTWHQIISKDNNISHIAAKELYGALQKLSHKVQQFNQQDSQWSESNSSKEDSQNTHPQNNYSLISTIIQKLKEQQELPQCLALGQKFKRLVKIDKATTHMIAQLPEARELRNTLSDYHRIEGFDLSSLSCTILSLNEFISKKENEVMQMTLERAKANNSISRSQYAFEGKRRKVLVLKKRGKSRQLV